MSDLYLTEHGSSVHKEGDLVVVRKESEKLFEIPIKYLETIQIFGNVQVSTQVIKELLERDIELAYYTSTGKLLGQITPPHVKNVELRFGQYELSKDLGFCLDFSKELIFKKFVHSISLLEDSNKNRENLDIISEIQHLRNWKDKLGSVSSLPELLGIEGSFSALYFGLYSKLFLDSEVFNGRSKRPPEDAGNAVLSFLNVIMANRISSYLDGVGFDPHVGFLHKLHYGRVSLACDLIEPIRSAFCERLVLRIFNRNLLKKSEDFSFEDDPVSVLLNQNGQKKFFSVLSKELNGDANFGYLRGNIQVFLIKTSEWLKKCVREQRVYPLDEI